MRLLSKLAQARLDADPELAGLVGQVQGPELLNPDPVAWIEEWFYIPETRGPIVLDAYQRRALRQLLATDGDGLFRYSIIVWSDIKKSAKSTLAAAVTLWRAWQVDMTDGWGSAYIIANDLKQADSRVAYYLRRAIQLNPALRRLCTIRNYRVTLPGQTFIEAVPIDPTGEAGSNADIVVFSELWGAHSKTQEQMWTEMTLPPNKFGRSFRWVETYAGYRGSSPLLERLYDQVVKNGQRLDDDLELYENPAARMGALWNTRPRLPWQTAAYYAAEEQALDASEFLRVHRNQWSDGGTAAFLPAMALWDACREDLPPLDSREPLIVALDAGVSGDTFAVVGVSRHPSRHDDVAVRYVRIYDPQGKPLDYGPIEQDLREFIATNNVVCMPYDPYQLHYLAGRLSDVVWMDEFSQGADRLEADRQLLDVIMQRRFAHNGDPTLRAHAQNADRKLEGDERKLRIVKRSPTLKIDALVAASMATYRCLSLNL